MTENQKLNTDLKTLAILNHKQWNHWLEYQNSCSVYLENGDLILPSNKIERWRRQIKTAYYNLSEQEKNSDREIASKWIKDIRNILFFSQPVKQMISYLKKPENLELVAQLEHEDWSRWTEYILDHGVAQEDGSLLLNGYFVEELEECLKAEYEELDNEYKTLFVESAKVWVNKVLEETQEKTV
ncbi:MAG: hypothetical protein JXM74_03175 [Fusobacteriaceae bacterium]|nr:hypothetical protein [Fusobacteriaceae bacterium]